MLMVNALAGTGKTSTGVFGLGIKVPNGMKVSPEQRSIIKIMRGFRGSQAAMAFNKSIADELATRVPPGCVAATSNAFGHRAWANHVGTRLSLDPLKSSKLCRDLIGNSLVWKERFRVENEVSKLVALCKSYMFDPCTSERENWIEGDTWVDGHDAMMWLCKRFDIESDISVLDYTVRTFTKSVESMSYIDYNDQIFMPLYHNVDMPKYGHLLADESQDFNRAKQAMIFKMGEHITAIGDRRQAIYGFSGADSESMDNMWTKMQESDDAHAKPLTITRRCPKKVVQLVNSIVPDFRCPDDAREGSVNTVEEGEYLKNLGNDISMIVCRVNAPLTMLAFRLLGKGKRCYIQGKDIGSGLKSEVRKTNESDLRKALVKVATKIDQKKMEIRSRDWPDENMIEALTDKMVCLDILADGCDNVNEFFSKIDSLFKDSGGPNDTRLSSVHKAKGLEHENVVIYKANKLRLPSKQKFQAEQEDNLAYVAYTRSLDKLTMVYEGDKGSDREE